MTAPAGAPPDIDAPGDGTSPPRSLLSAALIALAALSVMAVAQLAAIVVETLISGRILADLARGTSAPDAQALVSLMRVTALAQAVVIALVGLLATLAGGPFRRALRLGWPRTGIGAFVVPLAVTLALLVIVNAFVGFVLRHDLLADLELYRRALASAARGWAIGAIAFGAPVSEELLFRGLLLPALAATRLGFVPAALLTTAAWTGLHFSYSWLGLAEVALAGLVFAWAWRRSGSLWVPIVCHAAYNGTILLALLLWTT